MGERKGQNKYYPPDYDPKKGSLNAYHGTHALRERARKLDQGILIIRFEMPYNIWCEGCGNHIGMGVRYNAEKKKVGMYYTTPLWQFRMKCHLCTNHFEIKTDPQNFDYVIVSGARRQEGRWDPTQNGQVVPDDKEISRKMAADAMFRLEHGADDQMKSKMAAPSLARLENLQWRWKEDYLANKVLREQFRGKKKEAQTNLANDNLLLAKSSLNIPLIAESAEDVRMASLIQFTALQSCEEKQKAKREEIDSRPLFSNKSTSSNAPTPLAKVIKSIQGKNTGNPGGSGSPSSPLDFGIRRKIDGRQDDIDCKIERGSLDAVDGTTAACAVNKSPAMNLVSYDLASSTDSEQGSP